MTAASSKSVIIDCEFVAGRALMPGLTAITHACAHDVSVCLAARKHVIPSGDPTITFFVSVDTIFKDAAVWTLAGRVACFCPQARVAVHIAAPVTEAPETVAAPPSLQSADAA